MFLPKCLKVLEVLEFDSTLFKDLETCPQLSTCIYIYCWWYSEFGKFM